jgi:transcriptional regulator with XRE-family HTH domain
MSLKNLADKAGVSLSLIGNFETGITGIADDKLETLCEILGCRVEDIPLKDEEKKLKIVSEAGAVKYISDRELREAHQRAVDAEDWNAASELVRELARRKG